ncbi:MAG: DUF4242 domain-containing protein [Chitinophagales bacterium]
MKSLVFVGLLAGFGLLTYSTNAQSGSTKTVAEVQSDPSKAPVETKQLYLDVHHLPAGKITMQGVEAAHAKDLAIESKYGVEFLKYWVDTASGTVYCLASAPDSAAIMKSHAEAHGLLPDNIFLVEPGKEALAVGGGKKLWLDRHEFGPGNVKAEAVAGAHLKDLAVQNKYGVNFINYWVDERDGVVMCLAEASDSSALLLTHKEAHGLMPVSVEQVKQGK